MNQVFRLFSKRDRFTQHHRTSEGFNLLSIIGTVTLLAIIMAFVLAEIDPVARINEARDTKREQDVALFSYALQDYINDHQGSLPSGIDFSDAHKSVICSQAGTVTCDTDSVACTVINDSTFLADYLQNLPIAPDKASSTDTGYYLRRDTSGKIEVGACSYDDDAAIVRDTTIYAPLASDFFNCANVGGQQDIAGHCWVIASSGGLTCDGVCAENGATCEAGVSPSSAEWDAACSMHKLFEPTGCGYCYRTATNSTNYPAIHNTTYPYYCYVDYGNIVLCNSAASASYWKICPCE